jgi:hypothetical protein
MSSPIRNEAEQKTFCFVPIPSVERWRSQSRVQMNVPRTPLTAIVTAPKTVTFNLERPPRRP